MTNIDLIKRLLVVRDNPRIYGPNEVATLCEAAADALSRYVSSLPSEPTMGMWDDFNRHAAVPFGKFQAAYAEMLAGYRRYISPRSKG